MVIPTLYNIPEIDLYNILMSFITDNVTDIRTNRKNKRWVFDKFPTKNDNYPECVVDINSSNIESSSASQFLLQEKNAQGKVIKEMFFVKEVCPVKIRILTLKDSQFTVNINSSNRILKDKVVNLYLASQIKNLFTFKYIDLIKNYKYENISIIEKVRVTSVDRVYEANSRVWASDVIVTLDIKNLYVREYNGTGDIINEYSLVLNV